MHYESPLQVDVGLQRNNTRGASGLTKSDPKIWSGEVRPEQPREGEQRFFEQLGRSIRGRLSRMLGRSGAIGPDELDDLTQDGVLRVLRQSHKFRGGKFLAWASQVGVRGALSSLRRRRPRITEHFEERAIADIESPCPVVTSARRELGDAMLKAIDRALTERQRLAILAILTGEAPKDVAKRLNSSPNAVHKLCHDARQRLRVALAERGYDDLEIGEVINARNV